MTQGVMAARASFRLLAMLVLATALGPFSMQVFLPALPAMQAELQASALVAQLTVSLSALAIAVSMLVYGPVADALGRRPALLAGLVIFLAGSVLCAIADSIEALIVGRIVQAAGGSAGLVLSRTVVRDLYERDQAATMLAYMTMAMVAAPMLAPALGGVVADLTGWRGVFVLGAALGAMALVAVSALLVETRPALPAGRRPGMLPSFVRLMRSPAFRGYSLNVAFSVGVFYAFIAGAPYLMITVLERPASEYGLLFILVTGGFMIGNFASARISIRLGGDRLILIGSGGMLATAVLLVALVALGLTSPLVLFVPTALGAIAQGLAMPNAQAAAVSVDPQIAGSASGLAGFVQMGVAAIAAQIVGSIQIGSALPMALGMMTCALVAFLAARAGIKARR